MPRNAIVVLALAAVVTGLVAAGGRPAPAGQAATPGPGTAAACPATTPAENARLVRRRFDEVLSGHDLAVVDGLHAEDYAFHPSSGGRAAAGDAAEEERLARLLATLLRPGASGTPRTSSASSPAARPPRRWPPPPPSPRRRA